MNPSYVALPFRVWQKKPTEPSVRSMHSLSPKTCWCWLTPQNTLRLRGWRKKEEVPAGSEHCEKTELCITTLYVYVARSEYVNMLVLKDETYSLSTVLRFFYGRTVEVSPKLENTSSLWRYKKHNSRENLSKHLVTSSCRNISSALSCFHSLVPCPGETRTKIAKGH